MIVPHASLLAILVTSMLAGCTGWHIAGTSPHALENVPSRVRVTLGTGERVELTQARLQADTLVGNLDVDSIRAPVRRAVPVDSIRRVAVRGRTAETRSTSFFGGVAAATAAVWILLVSLTN